MPKQLEVYFCEICGNVVEVLRGEAGELVCCGENMKLMEEKGAAQEGKEKHVPVIEKGDGTVTVKVGSVPHPMLAEHYIEWVEVIADGKGLSSVLEARRDPCGRLQYFRRPDSCSRILQHSRAVV